MMTLVCFRLQEKLCSQIQTANLEQSVVPLQALEDAIHAHVLV